MGVNLTEEEWLEKDRKFERAMKKKGEIYVNTVGTQLQSGLEFRPFKFRIHSKNEHFKSLILNVWILNGFVQNGCHFVQISKGVQFSNGLDKMAAILFRFRMVLNKMAASLF